MMGISSCRLLQRWCPRLRFLPTAKDLCDPYRPTATGTRLAKGERDRLVRRFRGRDGERLPQQVPDLRDVGFATGTGQQAIVPDTVEAIGQDMDQETANELIGGQSHDRSSVAGLDAVILPAERDGLGISADQAVVRDRHAVRLAPEVGQHRFRATERRFGVDHPFRFAERGQPSGKGPGVGKPRLTAE